MADIDEKLLTILRLPIIKTVVVIQAIVYSTCLPLCIIYLNNHEFFEKTDLLKLLLLGFAFGSTMYCLIFALISFTLSILNQFGLEWLSIIESSTVVTNGVISIIILSNVLAYANTGNTIDIPSFILSVIGITFVAMIGFISGFVHRRLKKA